MEDGHFIYLIQQSIAAIPHTWPEEHPLDHICEPIRSYQRWENTHAKRVLDINARIQCHPVCSLANLYLRRPNRTCGVLYSFDSSFPAQRHETRRYTPLHSLFGGNTSQSAISYDATAVLVALRLK